VLAWQCVLFGESPGWGIGLGGKQYSIYCRVLHTATLALFLACLARVRIVQNTDISARCKEKMHPDKNITRQKVLIRYSTQNSCGNFHRKTANPPRSRLSQIIPSSKANTRPKHPPAMPVSKGRCGNFASAPPAKRRSTQILEFDHVQPSLLSRSAFAAVAVRLRFCRVPPSLLSRSAFASVAVRVCSRRRPRSLPSPSFDGASRLTFSLVES
jgi:hypothetical protein